MSNTNFPGGLDSPTNPLATNPLNSPSHSAQHGFENDAIVALETKIGVDNSSVVGSLDYKINHQTFASVAGLVPVPQGGTGITTYAKGDVIVGQSASVLSKLPVGTNGQTIVADSSQTLGVKWATSTAAPFDYQVFTANGTWTKPSVLSGTEMVVIQAWGGGGGGGGIGTGTGGGAAGGGGGGAFFQVTVPASILGTTVPVVVASVAAGAIGSVAGTTGNSTTFGSILTVYGGGHGGSSSGSINNNGGHGSGGGILSVGGDGGLGTGANGGNPLPGASSIMSNLVNRDSTFGGGGSSVLSANGGNSVYGGGGAGTTGGGGAGNSVYGGGGGGATYAGGGTGLGGISLYGGNGGSVFGVGNTTAGNGSPGIAPAGGGAGGYKNDSSSSIISGGQGARGEVRVWVI